MFSGNFDSDSDLDIAEFFEITQCSRHLIDTKLYNFESTLHEAALSNNVEKVKALLNQGVDKYAENLKGLVAFTYALVYKKEIDDEVLKLLRPNDDYWTETDASDRESMKIHQILLDSKTVVQRFLKYYDIDWKAIGSDGRSALHFLATNYHFDVFDLFMNADFDVDIRDEDGDTPLHYAARYNSTNAIEFLLNKGADVNIANLKGMTPLLCTVQPFDDGYKESALLLLENGADPQVTAFHEDCTKTFFEIVEEHSVNSLTFHIVDNLLESVVNQIVLNEMRGIPIRKCIKKEIVKRHYDSCVKQLDQMKDDIMFGSVSVYQFLTESENQIAKYSRSRDVYKWFDGFDSSVKSYDYYYNRLLRRRFSKAKKLNQWRNNAALIISQAINLFDSNHIVIEKIVNYLERKDLVMYL